MDVPALCCKCCHCLKDERCASELVCGCENPVQSKDNEPIESQETE